MPTRDELPSSRLGDPLAPTPDAVGNNPSAWAGSGGYNGPGGGGGFPKFWRWFGGGGKAAGGGKVAAAAPYAAAGGGMLASYLSNRKGGDEKAALAAQTDATRLGTAQSADLYNFGRPFLDQAGSYYSRLAKGDRAGMTAALTPEISAINESYAGAEKGLERSGVRGVARDVAVGELGREKAGRVSSLFPVARNNAMSAVAQLGQFGTSSGQSGTFTGGQMFGNLAAGLRGDRLARAESMSNAGATYGSLVYDLMKDRQSKR